MKLPIVAALGISLAMPALAEMPCEEFRNTDYRGWLVCLRDEVRTSNLELEKLVDGLAERHPDVGDAQARWTEERHSMCREKAKAHNNLEWQLLVCVLKSTRARMDDLNKTYGG